MYSTYVLLQADSACRNVHKLVHDVVPQKRYVLQVDRGAEAIMSATKQKNLAERSSKMGSQQLLGGPRPRTKPEVGECSVG